MFVDYDERLEMESLLTSGSAVRNGVVDGTLKTMSADVDERVSDRLGDSTVVIVVVLVA